MRIKYVFFPLFWIFSFLTLQAQTPTGLKSDGLVTDKVGLFTPSEKQMLVQKLRSYADSTSNRIAVVAVSTLNGRDAGEFATQLGHEWQLGDKKKDNGVIILIVKADKKAYIAVGRGLEGNIPDITAGRIYRNTLVPAFREGKFYEGVSQAIDQIILAAKGAYKNDTASDEGNAFLGFVFLFIIVVIIFVIVRAIIRGARRNTRKHHDYDGGGGYGGGFYPVTFGNSSSSDWSSSSSSSDSNWSSSDFGGGDFGGGGAGGDW